MDGGLALLAPGDPIQYSIFEPAVTLTQSSREQSDQDDDLHDNTNNNWLFLRLRVDDLADIIWALITIYFSLLV